LLRGGNCEGRKEKERRFHEEAEKREGGNEVSTADARNLPKATKQHNMTNYKEKSLGARERGSADRSGGVEERGGRGGGRRKGEGTNHLFVKRKKE
jgi:hypothetical protein